MESIEGSDLNLTPVGFIVYKCRTYTTNKTIDYLYK